MKSIVEEASSIMKAIEKGWASAGQPKEFTVKVYEEPQKNFIGMTTKPAKIGIFFTESVPQRPEAQSKRRRPPQEERARTQVERVKTQVAKAPKVREPQRREPTVSAVQALPEGEIPQRQGPIWTEEMIATVKNWITEMLPPWILITYHLLSRLSIST